MIKYASRAKLLTLLAKVFSKNQKHIHISKNLSNIEKYVDDKGFIRFVPKASVKAPVKAPNINTVRKAYNPNLSNIEKYVDDKGFIRFVPKAYAKAHNVSTTVKPTSRPYYVDERGMFTKFVPQLPIRPLNVRTASKSIVNRQNPISEIVNINNPISSGIYQSIPRTVTKVKPKVFNGVQSKGLESTFNNASELRKKLSRQLVEDLKFKYNTNRYKANTNPLRFLLGPTAGITSYLSIPYIEALLNSNNGNIGSRIKQNYLDILKNEV